MKREATHKETQPQAAEVMERARLLLERNKRKRKKRRKRKLFLSSLLSLGSTAGTCYLRQSSRQLWWRPRLFVRGSRLSERPHWWLSHPTGTQISSPFCVSGCQWISCPLLHCAETVRSSLFHVRRRLGCLSGGECRQGSGHHVPPPHPCDVGDGGSHLGKSSQGMLRRSVAGKMEISSYTGVREQVRFAPCTDFRGKN